MSRLVDGDEPVDFPAFHPVVAAWFAETLGEPTAPQRLGWPAIAAGRHALIAAPTGTGKTLAAFLWAIDGLLRRGAALADETQVLYVSPLRALSQDVQKNLAAPLEALRARDPSLPEVRVLVRTGDTPASARAGMSRRPPHVLVTTPESLFILLTSNGGRAMLSTVRTVIVDEIHALARDKRGSHLALSLERLEALVGAEAAGSGSVGRSRLQRIGLSATQKPLEAVARLLVGVGRECSIVDAGHLRALDLDLLVPDTPLSAVCSHDQWGELYAKMAALVREHRTTLLFVNTRKLAERLAARLTEQLGPDQVACHHGSLSREMRHSAEQRLKAGQLRALVATASLELGIDIGDVDLVLQVGGSRAIATLLQRVGRAGHGVHRTPKGRIVPLTLDEAVEGLALLASVRQGLLDATPVPPCALDILAQQIVAACVPHEWAEEALYESLRRAWPYRDLKRPDFDACVALHTDGRYALLHRDGVGGRLLASKRARIPALTSGGAIPDNTDYSVLLEPEGTFVGTLNEDFAVEANRGDIFQLGNTSWQILKVEPGAVRVADAAGQPPTLPFWLGEAPARTQELSAQIGALREGCVAAMSAVSTRASATPASAARFDIAAGVAWLRAQTAIDGSAGVLHAAAEQVAEFLAAGSKALGAVPSQRRVILERFFDESGGMQLVVHAPFGGRINRAFGLALRKRFCRGFGFELQAAANEEAIVISLATQHSFPLADVFNYLHPATTRELLVQALLAAPMFTTRWRWNVMRSLLLPRLRDGRKVPPALQRMRAGDLLTGAFPQAQACQETLPGGDIPVPMEHPIVRQTVEDCLNEAMDIDGLLALLQGLQDGRIERVAIDTPEPSPFAYGILSAQPYSFLDDAPLEERRTQAVMTRRTLDTKTADELGALDPDAIARVQAEAWPDPSGVEELHEALLWMGFATQAEAERSGWTTWLAELQHARRAVAVSAVSGGATGTRWFATEAPRTGKAVVAGRLEALGPVMASDPLFTEFADEIVQLESEGAVLRTRIGGASAWCNRRLLARIHRATLDRMRREIEPVSAADFLRFLSRWQGVAPDSHKQGPRGVLAVIETLAGWQAPAAAWERHILPARVADYRPAWLDELALSGEVAWGRLWGAGAGPIRGTPIALFPREQSETWAQLAGPGDSWSLSGATRPVYESLLAHGPSFAQELLRRTRLLPAQLEQALGDLVGLGLAGCDSFAGLRMLLARRRRTGVPSVGRWVPFRVVPAAAGAAGPTPGNGPIDPALAEFAARRLLLRTGVVFRRTIEREKLPVAWRDILRALRNMEVRGDVRGGRFVSGFSGEQYALPEAVPALRAARGEEGERGGEREPVMVTAADPLNFAGILTPDERIASTARQSVRVA